jgi:hypothetical protein
MTTARVIVDSLLEADVSRVLGAAFPVRRAVKAFTAALGRFGQTTVVNQYRGGNTRKEGQVAITVLFNQEVIEAARQEVIARVNLATDLSNFADSLAMAHLKYQSEKAVASTAQKEGIELTELHVYETPSFRHGEKNRPGAEWLAQVTVGFKL